MASGAELLAQALVSEDTEPFELTLKDGTKVTLQVKELTWTDESDAISKSVGVRVATSEDGKQQLPEMSYNPTIFRIEILKKRIVSSPFPFTDQTIRKLHPSVGKQLDALVPDPFAKMAAAEEAPKA